MDENSKANSQIGCQTRAKKTGEKKIGKNPNGRR